METEQPGGQEIVKKMHIEIASMNFKKLLIEKNAVPFLAVITYADGDNERMELVCFAPDVSKEEVINALNDLIKSIQ